MWQYLFLPLAIILGLLMMVKPEWFWKIEHFLDVKDGKPTEWYLAKLRLMGVGLFLLGAVACIVLLIL